MVFSFFTYYLLHRSYLSSLSFRYTVPFYCYPRLRSSCSYVRWCKMANAIFVILIMMFSNTCFYRLCASTASSANIVSGKIPFRVWDTQPSVPIPEFLAEKLLTAHVLHFARHENLSFYGT